MPERPNPSLSANLQFRSFLLAVLAGGFLLRIVVPPAAAAEGSPTGIDQSSFVSIGGIV